MSGTYGITVAGKYEFRREAIKDMLKEMFNRVAYTASGGEYKIAIDESRKF